MASAENFFGNITVDPGYFAILDLDLTENIAHPYWEILDPNPDINELFERFNNLLFDGTFTDEQRKKVTLNWFENKRGPLAGETYPPNSKKPIRIRMNERVLKPVLRKEVIETLIHEMIHAYLIATDTELDYDHCANFKKKMNEINDKANLNISVVHDYISKPERFIWRCRNKCRLMAPFFGFTFLKDEGKMPNNKTPMVLPYSLSKCTHSFERYTSSHKNGVSKWNCILHFVNVTKNFVRIKTSHAISQDPRVNDFMFVGSMEVENSFSSHGTFDDASSEAEISQNATASGYLIHDYITQRSPSRGYNSSHSTDNDCIESVHSDDDPHQVIEDFSFEDKFFSNFRKETKTFAKINGLNEKFANFLEKSNYVIVCMICEGHVDDDKAVIVEHLKDHSGIEFPLQPAENDVLPIYKLISSA